MARIRNGVAEAAINAYRIVKFGAADGGLLQSAAVGDKHVGVSSEIGSAVGERCDYQIDEDVDVQYGGPVTRGDLLTSNADGKAVVAAPAAGANNRIIGVALVSGVLDDIGKMNIAPSMMQG